MKTKKQPGKDTAVEFLKMVEDRSKFQGEVSYDYVAGFLCSVIKDLAVIPDVQTVLQLHLDTYEGATSIASTIKLLQKRKETNI